MTKRRVPRDGQYRPALRMDDWQRIVEGELEDARERGEFEGLPGEGQPLPGVDKPYDPGWWAKALVKREQIVALPPALELRRRVDQFEASVAELTSEAEVRAAVDALNEEIARVNRTTITGPPTDLYRLDVERVLAAWRARSS